MTHNSPLFESFVEKVNSFLVVAAKNCNRKDSQFLINILSKRHIFSKFVYEKRKTSGLDFVIDKLTNSIENVVTGDSFPTEITLVSSADLKNVVKKNGWVFNWKQQLKNPGREVYKLTIPNNPGVIQGLISLEMKTDHVYMHLVESAGFNKGKGKMYAGVPGNLVAFGCRLSFQRGFEGNVSFISKTQLIEHYRKTLDAIHVGGRIMIIESKAALNLINKYFKNI